MDMIWKRQNDKTHLGRPLITIYFRSLERRRRRRRRGREKTLTLGGEGNRMIN
jgi:hypothetical protein